MVPVLASGVQLAHLAGQAVDKELLFIIAVIRYNGLSSIVVISKGSNSLMMLVH